MINMSRQTHGHSWDGSHSSPTYAAWSNMLQRCTNPRHPNYHQYGARGISVCARWRKFENFLADMGERPTGLTLERIKRSGHYQKANCCWATWSDQVRNRRRKGSLPRVVLRLDSNAGAT
jgi:hypothetical protein